MGAALLFLTDSPGVAELQNSIVDVLKVAGARAWHKVENNAEEGHDDDAKDTLPADSLQRGHAVFAKELLLNHHLQRHHQLATRNTNQKPKKKDEKRKKKRTQAKHIQIFPPFGKKRRKREKERERKTPGQQ